MEEKQENIVTENLTRAEKIEKKIKTLKNDIKAKTGTLKILKKDLDNERAKEIFKLMDDTGINIDAAKKILKEAHQTGAKNE